MVNKHARIGRFGIPLFILLLAGLAGVVLFNPAYEASTETLEFIKAAVEKQKNIEENIQAYFQVGEFSFSSPLVIQDPYGLAPLTALVMFDTPINVQVSIHVAGKSPEAAVEFTFPGYQTHHEIPIYGLLPGTLNQVTIQAKTEDGESEQAELQLQTEPLPVYLEPISVDSLNRTRYSPGFNFTFLSHKTIFDLDGAVRWYTNQATFQVFTQLKNGRFLYTYATDFANILMEQDLLGKIYATYNFADEIHHDIFELPNGNLLLSSENRKSETVEDQIIEVDRQSGRIVRSFDLKNILDPDRPPEIGWSSNDWLHLNSIFYDPTDSSIMISGRAQSAVVKLSYPEMKILWILGPHDNWSKKYQPYLLTPTGENFEWQWTQHHATLYGANPAGDNLLEIQLFDNGMYRSFDPARAYSPGESYSRLVRYRINEKLMTVEQTWEYGKERGSAIFSNSVGSSYLLSNGNLLGTWGDIARDAAGKALGKNDGSASTASKIIEVDPSNNEVIFESSVPGVMDYRTFRAGLYDGYSEGSHILAARLNDTSGNDLFDRGQMVWVDMQNSQNPLVILLKRAIHKVIGLAGL